MNQMLIHRGPDDDGYYRNQFVDLAMRRLSIIDVQSGHQPISNEDGTKTIVFNGEIYNYLELKKRLANKGHVFKTSADTEVILHLYEEYREDCVNYLNGMFAFAIWDKRTETLFTARDPMGIKPLFYSLNNGKLAIASELKAIMQCSWISRDLDHQALYDYLAFCVVPCPETLFTEVKQLPPGHYLTMSREGFLIGEYWNITSQKKVDRNENVVMEELNQKLGQSVRNRLMSEVPLGAFLSGGVDSGLIVCLMSQMMEKKVRTISIGFGDEAAKYDETRFARNVADRYNTEHYHHIVSEENLIQELPNIAWSYDQPRHSGIHIYFASKFAREAGLTVALSGLGGDELFCGYSWSQEIINNEKHYRPRIPGKISKAIVKAGGFSPVNSVRERIIHWAERMNGSFSTRYKYTRLRFLDHQISSLMKKDNNFKSPARIVKDALDAMKDDSIYDKVAYHDLRLFMLNDCLPETDHLSMIHSLEVRVPFLEKAFVEWTFSVPDSLKFKGGEGKYILKKYAERFMPSENIYRPKMGFLFPIDIWLRQGRLNGIAARVFEKENVKKRNLFNPDEMTKIWQSYLQGKESWSKIWALVALELWMKIYIDNDTVTAPTYTADEML